MVRAKGSDVHRLSRKEGREMLDKLAHRYLDMTVDEFMTAWDSGALDAKAERPEVVRLAMLLPFARDGR